MCERKLDFYLLYFYVHFYLFIGPAANQRDSDHLVCLYLCFHLSITQMRSNETNISDVNWARCNVFFIYSLWRIFSFCFIPYLISSYLWPKWRELCWDGFAFRKQGLHQKIPAVCEKFSQIWLVICVFQHIYFQMYYFFICVHIWKFVSQMTLRFSGVGVVSFTDFFLFLSKCNFILFQTIDNFIVCIWSVIFPGADGIENEGWEMLIVPCVLCWIYIFYLRHKATHDGLASVSFVADWMVNHFESTCWSTCFVPWKWSLITRRSCLVHWHTTSFSDESHFEIDYGRV